MVHAPAGRNRFGVYIWTLSARTDRPGIVFAGGGHAHLYALRRTAELVRRGFDVTLVDPHPHLHYSGMATGVISGSPAPGSNRIDVRRLVERGGGRFVQGRVHKVLPEDRTLLLEDGTGVAYDAVSFCLGSETRSTGAGIPIKPVENTAGIRARILDPGHAAPHVLVVGGGAAGCEVAANAAALMRDRAAGGAVTLVEAGPTLLESSPKKAQRLVLDHLRAAGVEVILGREAKQEDGAVVLDDGRRIPADLTVAATGVEPPDVFRRSHLPTGDDGALWLNRHLQSPRGDRIFGGGDAVAFRGGRLPQLGVFAVRQAPVLYHNLQAVIRDEPLVPFEPQSRFLYILNLGGTTGLAIYGPLVLKGRLALEVKHGIDERFVAKYRG